MPLFTNIHKIASSLIPRERFEYRISGDNVLSAAGRIVPTYGEWRQATGHIQPGIVSSFGGKNIEEKDYKDMGLDFSHRYLTIWHNIAELGTIADRQSACQVRLRGKVFNVIHSADWIVFDGFKRIYVEEVVP